jgi:hypothetical protein
VSNVNWRKSAARDVRPFFGVATLESSLHSAQIRLFENADFSDATAYLVEPQDLPKLAIAVRANLNVAGLASATVRKGDLVLAVTAAQPFLKKTCVITRLALNAHVPDEIEVGSEILEQLGGGSNLVIEIALCLSKRLPKKPGSPYLQGHWLSKKSFDLRAPKPADEFEIQPMSDDDWKKLGWPAKTLYSVDYLGGFNEQVAKGQALAKVRIHEDIHKKLTLESNQRLAKPIMASLAAEMIRDVVVASLDDWVTAQDVTPNSPLSAFLKRISRVQPCTFEELKALATRPGMQQLTAILHAEQQSVRAIAEG